MGLGVRLGVRVFYRALETGYPDWEQWLAVAQRVCLGSQAQTVHRGLGSPVGESFESQVGAVPQHLVVGQPRDELGELVPRLGVLVRVSVTRA